MKSSKRSTEYWYLARKLEMRMIGHCEGAVKGKKALKRDLIKKQKGICGLSQVPKCPKSLETGQIEVDRIDTRWNYEPSRNFGYLEENCRAVHAACHRAIKEGRDTWKPEPWVEARKKELFKSVDKLLEDLSTPSAE